MKVVKQHFKPEFLNRLDDIVLFTPLSTTNLHQILKIQIQSLTKRLESRDISVELNKEAMDLFIKSSYDPIYGARPMKRYLEKHVVTQLSKLLISGELTDHCQVKITVEKEQLKFNILSLEPPQKKVR